MKIPSGYQPAFQLINPLFLFEELAFGTVAVVARVVGLLFKTAMSTTIDVPTQIAGAAGSNIVECFDLGATQTLPARNLFKAGI